MSQPGAFVIQLREPPEVAALASEKASGFAGVEVTVDYGGTGQDTGRADAYGRVTIVPRTPQMQAVILEVRRNGPHAQSIKWSFRLVNPKYPPATAGMGASGKGYPLVVAGPTAWEVEISARARLSLWCNGGAFASEKTVPNDPRRVLLHPTRISELRRTRGIDDISLLQTITFKRTPRGPDVMFAANFAEVAGTSERKTYYLRDLIDTCQRENIQVFAGYEIVETGTTSTEGGKAFTEWLLRATKSDIRDHAKRIVDFFAARKQSPSDPRTIDLPIDGIGFDLEINGLGEKHAPNLELLFYELATLLAPQNRILTYATAGFLNDGETTLPFMKAQPFRLAKIAPNIIARPMAYDDGTNGLALARRHEKIIDCALRKTSGGAGLHPSQIQLGVKTAKVGSSGRLEPNEVEARCRDLLHRHRVGLIDFHDIPIGKLTPFDSYDKALNPGEKPRGTAGQPLQVPRK